jgi:DNA-binding SARP family transcriptional activator
MSLVRALDCRAEALSANNELVLALTHAREAVRLEPYRESGYRRLMRLLASNGDRGEAVRAYQQCRDLLDKELGVAPSSETETLFRELSGD